MANDARALAARIWAASGRADDSPGRVYLAQRCAWPPLGIGPDLPVRVCWLAAERAPATCEATKWYGLPAGACGALVFGWRRLDSAPGQKGGAAVSLLAVNQAGERVPWFGPRRSVTVRTIGSRSGAVFEARTGESSDPVHVARREIDALALAVHPRHGPGADSGRGPRAPAHRPGLERHGGRGRGARGRRLGRRPGRVRIEPYGRGESPASVLAGEVGERAGILEDCDGLTSAEAERLAWTALAAAATCADASASNPAAG